VIFDKDELPPTEGQAHLRKQCELQEIKIDFEKQFDDLIVSAVVSTQIWNYFLPAWKFSHQKFQVVSVCVDIR
jgi:hypothetical protein